VKWRTDETEVGLHGKRTAIEYFDICALHAGDAFLAAELMDSLGPRV